MIDENLTEFAGKPVQSWEPGMPLDNPQGIHYRIRMDWDESSEGNRWTDKFGAFLAQPRVSEITGFVVGAWGEVASGDEPTPIIEALVAAQERLPNLKALFFGDIVMEESEISWIHQSDMSPLLSAYPQLEHLVIRGSEGLTLGKIDHAHLKTLTLQSGGLNPNILREVCAADLPALEHLELWLGDPNYGGNATLADVLPLLQNNLFPKLTYLGLCNTELTDAIAEALKGAPILEQIRTLDLSLGTLSDVGGQALLDNPALLNLESINLCHHYLSEAMETRLMALRVEIDISDRRAPDTFNGESHRYVAVSE